MKLKDTGIFVTTLTLFFTAIVAALFTSLWETELFLPVDIITSSLNSKTFTFSRKTSNVNLMFAVCVKLVA